MSSLKIKRGKLALNLGESLRQNWSAAQLIEANIAEGRGRLSSTGAVMVDTGIYTGRSPKDKYFVREPSSEEQLWWGEVNQPIDQEIFESLYSLVHTEYEATTDEPT